MTAAAGEHGSVSLSGHESQKKLVVHPGYQIHSVVEPKNSTLLFYLERTSSFYKAYGAPIRPRQEVR